MEKVNFADEIQPSFAQEKLVTRLGGRKNRRLSCATRNKVHTSREKVQDLIKPRITYRIREIQNNNGRLITLENQTRFKSPKLARTLRDGSQVVCFVATIGRAIEKEIKKLMHINRLSEAYIIDSLGSVAIEDMVDRFQKRMTSELDKGGQTSTLRFSPGYCDWPITEQKKLFALLNTGEIDVRLTDSCLMSPRKSISGIFGITSKSADLYNPCVDCHRTKCEARRN